MSLIAPVSAIRPLAIAAVLLVLAGCATPPAPPPGVLSAWTQFGPQASISVRAIVPQGSPCPPLNTDQGTLTMPVRAAGNGDAPPAASANPAFQPPFPVTACAIDLPAGARTAAIAGEPLPLPPAVIGRIVILGDTGCRIKVPAAGPGDPIQDCSDPHAWPWARIAAAAARERPDLVIHVGDYHYREYCDDPVRCAPLRDKGVIVGSGWSGWQADFFRPAAPLLAQAPWVFVRGNHENCDRGGEGWMRFLSPVPYQACPDQRYKSPTQSVLANNLTDDAWRIDLDAGLGLLVVDNAGQQDYLPLHSTPQDIALFERQLAVLRQPAPAPRLWLLSHRPLWYDLLTPSQQPNAFQAALQGSLPASVQLAIGGHEHAFQTLNFATAGDPAGRPAQLVVGGSGTQLEAQDPASPLYEGKTGPRGMERGQPDGRLYDGLAARSGILLLRHGFLVLDRDERGWAGRLLDADGGLVTRCRIDDARKEIACAWPSG